MIYIEIFLLVFSTVILIDQSGFINTLKEFISLLLTRGRIKTSNYRLRPFDCSLCLSFWLSLLYVNTDLTIYTFSYICLLSFLTIPINDLLIFIKTFIQFTINKLSEKLF